MFGLTEILVITFSILLIVLVKQYVKNPPPILGIYQRPNGLYWLKVGLIYSVLSLRKLKSINTVELLKMYAIIDKAQKFSHHDKAIDAVYLNGANNNGDHIVVGTARRKNRLVDGFLYLKINSSKFGLLETPKLPETALYKTEDSEEFSAEGIKIIPVEPMRKWILTYEGKMKEFSNRKLMHDVKIEGTWTSSLPYFNFDTDMDSLCMAKSMAYERWSRNYFENVKANHQTHYEQFGSLKATIMIDTEQYKIELDTVRDHSFGDHREWRQFKRYGLHFFSTENGDRFHVGKICLPISFSRLTIGYVYNASDREIYPVTDCDLELYQHGELGTPPKDYAFSFTAGNKKYVASVKIINSPHFYISKDCEVKIFEGLGTFDVNGVKGWGAAEWQYRNIEGKLALDLQ